MKDIYISGSQSLPEKVDIFSDSSFENGNPVPHEKKKKRKRKKSKAAKVIKAVFAVFICVTLLISGLAFVSGYSYKSLKYNEYISFFELRNNPLVTNILLIGTDEESGGASRSDSMILLSLDYIHGKIKMTSFLRDCLVEIPSKNKKMKLNSAFVYGGAQLLCDTIEYNFLVDIDHYIKVDFEMFTEIIDKIGGIDVEVTKAEAQFINRTTRHTVSSGESVHLNGSQALVYARIRKLDSDYMRTFRQRKIITALIDKITHTSPPKLFGAVNSVLPLLETDLNPFEIAFTSYKGLFAAVFFKIQQIKMPEDNMMTTGYVGSQWAEIPDIEKCRSGIYDFIYKSYK